jgi:3-dehydroquinate synthetase
LGFLEEDFQQDLEALLTKFNLPTSLPRGMEKTELLAAMKYDKKRDTTGLKFILPKKIGEVCIQYVEEKDIFREI